MNELKLLAVGDISLIWKNNRDPFEHVKSILIEKDILFGNLETVLSLDGPKSEKAVLVYTDPKNVIYLKSLGFDILNLANNHSMDLGELGLNNTLNILHKNGINFIGVINNQYRKKHIILEKNNIRLGFLGYCSCGYTNFKKKIIINSINEKIIKEDIEKIKRKCDLIIVSLHWGIENIFYPSPKQVKLARKLIDSGAHIILGHHPHVLQGIEQYNGGIIAYSLGNFQFEYFPQTGSEKNNERTNQTIILSLTINRNGIKSYDIIPIKINEEYCPMLPADNEKEEILKFISYISKPLNSGIINEKRWFEEISEEYLVSNYKSWIIRINKYGLKHLLHFLKWVISPFNIKCYFGFIRRKIKNIWKARQREKMKNDLL